MKMPVITIAILMLLGEHKWIPLMPKLLLGKKLWHSSPAQCQLLLYSYSSPASTLLFLHAYSYSTLFFSDSKFNLTTHSNPTPTLVILLLYSCSWNTRSYKGSSMARVVKHGWRCTCFHSAKTNSYFYLKWSSFQRLHPLKCGSAGTADAHLSRYVNSQW